MSRVAFLAQDIHKVAVGRQLWLQSLRLDWDWCTHCPLPRGLKSVPPPRGLSAARVLRAEQLVSLRLSNRREHPRNCHALLNLDLTYPPLPFLPYCFGHTGQPWFSVGRGPCRGVNREARTTGGQQGDWLPHLRTVLLSFLTFYGLVKRGLFL